MNVTTETRDGRVVRIYEDDYRRTEFFLKYTIHAKLRGLGGKKEFATLQEAETYMSEWREKIARNYGGYWLNNDRTPLTCESGEWCNLKADGRCWITCDAGDIISNIKK